MASWVTGGIWFLLTRWAVEAACPCITDDGGALEVYKVGGQLYYNGYPYPNDYGLAGCRAYDSDPTPLQPYCGNAAGSPLSGAPAWCNDTFCYVDPADCDLDTTLSGVFPDSGLHYSYETCGGESTFDSWFGANGTGASTYSLSDLADVVETYVLSLRRDIESSYTELEGVSTYCDHSHTGCPCSTCSAASGWGTGVTVDFSATMLKEHATTPVTARTTCLSQSMHAYFMKIAGAEYYDRTKFANLYGGFQEDGALSMYPEYSWCPTSYDPRFRPWYSTAATNPKLLIVVIDVSGSMSISGRIDLAKDAALAVLDTLTWNDDVGFILFNGAVRDVYPVTACTDANRTIMQTWITNNVYASGATNFVDPLTEAFWMIESSTSTACSKAVLFLTDGEASFSELDYKFVEDKAELHNVVMFTYALGSDADATVAKKLACDNSGIFYNVADNADLPEIMSSYYSYFAASIRYVGARWILYNDYATDTELLSACTPLYDTSDPSLELSVLIGAVCMDINLIVEVSQLRSHPEWSDMYDRVLATSQSCSQAWVGMSEKLKLTVLETIRTLNVNNGASLCGNAESSEDDSSGSSGETMIIAAIVVCVALTVLVLLGTVCHKKGHSVTPDPQKTENSSQAQPQQAQAPEPQQPAAGYQLHQGPNGPFANYPTNYPVNVNHPVNYPATGVHYAQPIYISSQPQFVQVRHDVQPVMPQYAT